MKKRGRQFLYPLPTTIVISAIVLSILVGTGTLYLPQKVSAASANEGDVQKISDLATILPIHPLLEQAVDVTNATALPACLKSTTLPLCYSPQQMRQAYRVQPLLHSGSNGNELNIPLIRVFMY